MALFVGRLPPDCRTRELESVFAKYGRITRCDIKRGGYGFVEFEDARDAEDALKACDGMRLAGERIVVEWAKGAKRAPGSEECFKCGKVGHYARNCPLAGGVGNGGRYDRGHDRDRNYDTDRSRSRERGRRHNSRSPPRGGASSYRPSGHERRDHDEVLARRDHYRHSPVSSRDVRGRSRSRSPARQERPRSRSGDRVRTGNRSPLNSASRSPTRVVPHSQTGSRSPSRTPSQ